MACFHISMLVCKVLISLLLIPPLPPPSFAAAAGCQLEKKLGDEEDFSSSRG